MLPSAPPAPRIAQSRKFLNWQRWRFVLKNSATAPDRKSTRLNSSHGYISYAVFCLKKKNHDNRQYYLTNRLPLLTVDSSEPFLARVTEFMPVRQLQLLTHLSSACHLICDIHKALI